MSYAQQKQFSVAWMRLWISSYHLGLPLAIIVHWKATVWKKISNFYWDLIKLYSTQNGFGHVCVPYAVWLLVSFWWRVLSRDSLSIIAYVSPKWIIKWKIFGSRQVYEQLLSSVLYATLCPICKGMGMIFVYWTTHQLLWWKIDFFSSSLISFNF